jgi:hypothetical protein
MTNNEFCARLRKAKPITMKFYKMEGCFYLGCDSENIILGSNAIFGEGTEYERRSARWVRECKPTKADIARVFDESIKALGGEP